MKKTYFITLVVAAAVMISGCGRQKYNDFTPTTPGSSVDAASNAIDKFNTIWVSENNLVGTEFAEAQKRTLSNFFGYNEAYKAWNGCKYGYENFNTMTCFDAGDPLRNYFLSHDYSYKPYPAPKDFGTVKYYKIRFAANVDDATGEMVEGDAYLDIELHTATETFTAVFSTVKTSLVVDDSTGDIAVTLQDDCGDISLNARLLPSGQIVDVDLSFLNTPDSYKKASCYHDGQLPDPMRGYTTMTYPSTAPTGMDVSGGRGRLFYSESALETVIADMDYL